MWTYEQEAGDEGNEQEWCAAIAAGMEEAAKRSETAKRQFSRLRSICLTAQQVCWKLAVFDQGDEREY